MTRGRRECPQRSGAAGRGVVGFSTALRAECPKENRAYSLAPGDKLTMAVFGQPEPSGDLLVSCSGDILLPFTGSIEVKVLTLLECRKLIHNVLVLGILTLPSVSLRVTELRPISILGDARTAGACR
jgi:polysaccharide biosynthesis/export protein